jgi:disulfide oxidoreductase YuzD
LKEKGLPTLEELLKNLPNGVLEKILSDGFENKSIHPGTRAAIYRTHLEGERKTEFLTKNRAVQYIDKQNKRGCYQDNILLIIDALSEINKMEPSVFLNDEVNIDNNNQLLKINSLLKILNMKLQDCLEKGEISNDFFRANCRFSFLLKKSVAHNNLLKNDKKFNNSFSVYEESVQNCNRMAAYQAGSKRFV